MLSTTGFRVGVNLPWIRYGCDFGANRWQPSGGLSARGVPDDVKRGLGRLAAADITLIRWFLFADGRAGIRFTGEEPSGLDAWILDDVTVALDLAASAGVDLLPTLFDFHWCHPARVEGGVQLGGHARVFRKADLRAALLDQVLTPLLRAVGDHPRIAAWDIINEPEWVTGGVRRLHPWSQVRWRPMRRSLADITALVHALSPHPVTVGLASARWAALVDGLDLDFYQVHWYDKIDADRPPDDPAVVAAFDKPVMIGEFPTAGSRYDLPAFLEMARRGGYFAALPWSLLSDDAAAAGANAVSGHLAARAGTESDLDTSDVVQPEGEPLP